NDAVFQSDQQGQITCKVTGATCKVALQIVPVSVGDRREHVFIATESGARASSPATPFRAKGWTIIYAKSE
ncbi:MAG: hypothetical protein RBU24_02500, partial [Kiritimatiellia bacterium]|nr:hypothetical protein [Kiritimatiellia bacterium]